MRMRYVISDIHGEYELFEQLLEKICFSDGDVLYVCGDIIEKGDSSIRLANRIFKMHNAKCIIGNHEYAFLKNYHALMKRAESDYDAVLKELQDYFSDDGQLLDWELVDWFDALPYYIEEDDFVCVHAGVPLDGEGRMLPLEKALPEQLVYDRTFKELNVKVTSGKCVFFGHTPTSYICGESIILPYLRPQKSGDCISDYYKVHLDLGTWMSGTLGCFCIETCECIYVKKAT